MIKIIDYSDSFTKWALNESHTRAVFYKRGADYVLYRALPCIKTKLGTRFRKLEKFVSQNFEHLIP